MSRERRVPFGLAACAGLILMASSLPAADDQAGALPAPLGSRLADWTLPRGDNGQAWSLNKEGREAKAVVVLFIGTQCPINNLYMPILADMQRKYADKGVVFVAVNSNAQDDAADIARHAKEYALPFVVLRDEGAKLADRFAAQRTPEAFVLDGTRTVRYRGRIDDRYDKGVQRARATRHDLTAAVDAVLAGKAVEHPVTEPAGCPVGRPPHTARSEGRVTYNKEISRIVQRHCQDCHRPGEAAPFSLLSYKNAVDWSAAMKEEVEARRMPPWHADPAHGEFSNCRRLPDADRAALLAWVDQGCPEGDPADLPAPRTFVKGWRIGKPDDVFTMPEAFEVPAQAPKGGVPYRFVVISEPFAEDKWVQSVECRPGVAAVVHHITAFVVPPDTNVANWNKQNDMSMLSASYSDDNFLGGDGPGEQPMILPPGEAKFIPKGARIALEVHYQPNGTPCSDRSYVGFVYAKEAPKHRVMTGSAKKLLLMIPPRNPNYRVVATRTFERDAMLLSLCPHMHLRGKSGQFDLVLPDGSREVLLSVPRWDIAWQTNYNLAKPKFIPKGAKIEYTVVYDNSSANVNNPDPSKYVTWGEQTWDEMMIGFFEYYWADEKTE
jgi:thiol-disulfide isomerase/thioredoxin